MTGVQTIHRLPRNKGVDVDLDKLGQALRHCHDPMFLQTSELTRLPGVVRRSQGQRNGVGRAKALRKELIAAAKQMTRPHTRHHSIRKIVRAIEEQRLSQESQLVQEIQQRLGIPFSRDRLDLARYYAIRLVMEGLTNETIAEFLLVERRTLANYVAQARERIALVLEDR